MPEAFARRLATDDIQRPRERQTGADHRPQGAGENDFFFNRNAAGKIPPEAAETAATRRDFGGCNFDHGQTFAPQLASEGVTVGRLGRAIIFAPVRPHRLVNKFWAHFYFLLRNHPENFFQRCDALRRFEDAVFQHRHHPFGFGLLFHLCGGGVLHH